MLTLRIYTTYMNRFEDSFLSTEALEKERSDIEDFYKSKVQRLSFKTKDGYTVTAAKMDADDATDTQEEVKFHINLLNFSILLIC